MIGKKHAPKHAGKGKRVVVAPQPAKASQEAHKPVRRLSGKMTVAVVALLLISGGYAVSDFVNQAWLSEAPALQAQETALNEYKQKKAEQQAETKAVTAPAAGDKTTPAKKAPAYSMENLPEVKDVPTGEEYGIVRVPSWGAEWEKALIEGNKEDWNANNALLDRLGVVHYQSTAQPGEIGNFAVAGHRNGYGSVFTDIQTLKKGDTVEVETLEGTFVYSVIEEGKTISPDDNTILDSDPLSDKKNTTRKLLTLTTCEWWDASRRVVVVAELSGFKAP